MAAAVSSPLSGQEHKVETIHVPAAKETAPVITVVDLNKTYAIRLGCVACPFGMLDSHSVAQWQHPPPDSSLVKPSCRDAYPKQPTLTWTQLLALSIDKSASALVLNGERVFPLDPRPPRISAVQVPTVVAQHGPEWQADKAMSERITFPLQYEHTLFRAKGDEGLWFQFNVTGLAWGEGAAPFKMGQKALQILLRESQKSGNEHALSIADVQVVGEEDGAQPPRMKCGRLAMVQTAFDPNEWDEYGKFGTWKRTRTLLVSHLGAFWSGCLHCIDVVLPLTLLLAAGIFVRCRSRQQARAGGGCTAETSLLGCRGPPPYDIPVIKIEQYD